ATRSGRNLTKQFLDQGAQRALDVAIAEVRAHQPDAAVDVVTDSAGRNDAALVRVGGADAADAEAVAPVDVRHGQAGVLDTRQKCNVGHLVRRLVLANLLQQALVGEDESVHAHARLVALWDAPAAVVDLLQRPAKDVLHHDGVAPSNV